MRCGDVRIVTKISWKPRGTQDTTGRTLSKITEKKRQNLWRLYEGYRHDPGRWMETPIHLKYINTEFLLSKAKAVTESGAEMEGKAMERPLHLAIHIIYRHQPRNYGWWPEMLTDSSLV